MPPSSGLVGFLIKRGLVKSEAEANTVLLGVVALCILVMAVVWWRSGRSSPAVNELLTPPAGAGSEALPPVQANGNPSRDVVLDEGEEGSFDPALYQHRY